jgi:hypothetical protein
MRKSSFYLNQQRSYLCQALCKIGLKNLIKIVFVSLSAITHRGTPIVANIVFLLAHYDKLPNTYNLIHVV